MTKNEIEKSLKSGVLPHADFDGSGRALIISDCGIRYIVRYRYSNPNDWAVLGWERLRKS